MDSSVNMLPGPLRDIVRRHSELVKFAIVGATTMVFDLAIYYTLAFSVLEQKPTIAKVISGVLATILSYLLNRGWSFRNRGGRRVHQEALLFFGISGIGVIIAATPMWIANNVLHIRAEIDSRAALVVLDFVLNYIIGNLAQMVFRFWALRRFAFPDDLREPPNDADADATDRTETSGTPG